MVTSPAPDAVGRTPPHAAGQRPSRGDVVAAAVTGAVAVAGLLALPLLARLDTDPAADAAVPADVPAGSAGWWLVLLALAAQAVALAWVRSRPRAVLLGVSAAAVVAALAAGAGAGGLTGLAVLVAVYRAAVAVPFARLRGVLPVVLALLTADGALRGTGVTGSVPLLLAAALGQAVLLVALPLGTALVVASRRAVREAQAGELRALARERDALVRTAVATERTAMARELHDIAAHHLSGIALMASAIDRQIDTDPAAAHQGVRAVRDQSRVVLQDLRRLVGLLRADDPAETEAASLAAVPGLVAAAGAVAGAPTTVEVLRPEGADGELGAGVGPLGQLTAYRMVQEALANARSHAPGAACRVMVDDRGAAAVVVAVRNDPPALVPAPAERDDRGHGLRGMRERADLVGATLRHGPTPDGGWEVRLTLPREPRERPGTEPVGASPAGAPPPDPAPDPAPDPGSGTAAPTPRTVPPATGAAP
ncbi:sensor histidine kinase [Cellulomonas olei]|uniref:sensor histidine kinase n=1 Tax=Cellulomonas sp. P4 TaxID=3142533 RepID=UPI0031BBC64F